MMLVFLPAIPLSFKISAAIGVAFLALESFIVYHFTAGSEQYQVIGNKTNITEQLYGLPSASFENWESLPIKEFNYTYPGLNSSPFNVTKYYNELQTNLKDERCGFSFVYNTTICYKLKSIDFFISNNPYVTPPINCKSDRCQIEVTYHLDPFKYEYINSRHLLYELTQLSTQFNNHTIRIPMALNQSQETKYLGWYQPIYLRLSGSLIYFHPTLKSRKTLSDTPLLVPLVYNQIPVGIYGIKSIL